MALAVFGGGGFRAGGGGVSSLAAAAVSAGAIFADSGAKFGGFGGLGLVGRATLFC